MTSISFVLPVYNHWELTHKLLFDLYKNIGECEIIVVDDASPNKDVQAGLQWWSGSHMIDLETITLKNNSGFLISSNIGLKAASGDVICLISNDVLVSRDFSPSLRGIAHKKSLLGGRLLDWDTGWNTVNGKIHPYLEGWILACSRGGWKELEYFDELFAPNDMEDVDLSTKAVSLGYNLELLPEGCVTHLGAQTIGYGDSRESITKKNKIKFEEKWK